MNYIRNLNKQDRSFFEDEFEKIKYHVTCSSCTKVCKQSFKNNLVMCLKRISAHTPDEYIEKIKKSKKTIEEVGKEIGINSRTVKSMLYERQDMSEELYIKLEKLLYNKDLSK